MRWFKHYSDMHEGQTITTLMDEMGHAGLCFFLLQEMCAEKLERPDELLTESDLSFRFNARLVREKLRLSATNVRRLLDISATMGQLSYEWNGSSIEIKMPILLELLSRDTKKARLRRAADAAKPRLDKDKEEDKDTDKDKEVLEKKKSAKKTASPVTNVTPIGQALVGVYCDAWKARYKTQSYPPIRNQDAKQLKSFGEANGIDKTKALINAFLDMPDSFFVMKRHDLATFLNNTAVVAQYLDSGTIITRAELKNLDQQVANQNQYEMFARLADEERKKQNE